MLLRGLGPVRMTFVAVAVGVLAASCGTAKTPGGPTSGAKLAVRIVQSPGARGGAEKAAQAYAMRLLAKLELPAGARRTAWPIPESRLLKPMLGVWLGDVVDVQMLYRVGVAMSPVRQFLTAHVPSGMRQGEGGQVGSRGTAEAEYVDYVPEHLPPGIASAEIATAIVPSGGGSLLQADAQVVWSPSRSAAEYIQAGGYRSVTVTIPSGSGSAMTRTFTSQEVIAELASLLNRMPALAPSVQSCPMIPAGPGYSVLFTPRAGRWPRVIVTPSGCFSDGISDGGRSQPVLHDSGDAMISTLRRLALPAQTH